MVVLFASRIQPPILAVAIGVSLGGLVQFAFQLPAFFRNGFSLRPEFDFQHPGLKKMSLLVLPATMGMAVVQINIFVSTILASYLPEGSITYLYYSMRLIQFPIGIFGVAMGMAVLPALSEHAVKGKYDKLGEDFSFALRLLFFITVPAMAGLIALREPIVNILFQRGKFDYIATAGTAEALLFYSLGIWSIVGVRVVTACFYSMQDTRTPVKIAVIALVTNVLLSLMLMQPLRHSGLALANTLASVVNFVLLFVFLKKKLVSLNAQRIVSSFFKTLIASVVMGALGMLLLHGDWWTHHADTLQKAFALAGTISACIIVYIMLSFVMRNEECFYVLRTIKEKLAR